MVGSSRELGKYRLVNEVAKSQLGALWAGLGSESSEGEEAPLVLVRRFDTSVIANADQIDTLSEAAWWAMELATEQIARTVDVVKTGDELGMVYAYAEGEVFRALVRLATFKRKPFPVPVALRVLLDVLEAVATARAQASEDHIEISCGGLSPDSVFVSTDGITRLLDVGAAGVLCGAERVLNNPEMAAYAAPEQLEEEGRHADARSDVFTAGVLAAEMLLGKRLFVGSNYAAVSTKVKEAKVPRLDASKPAGGQPIPAEVADLVARALSPNPEDRFADCRELIAAIEALSIEPAERETVGEMVEALDGNALSTRRKVIDRARGAKPTAKPIPSLPKPGVAAPKPPPKPPGPPPKPAAGAHRPPPPPPRAPMESLDSELLQPDSQAPESGGVPIDVELDAPKVPADIPPPPGFEESKTEGEPARTSKPDEVSEGALIEALTTDTTPHPESAKGSDSGDKEGAEAKSAEENQKVEEEEKTEDASEAPSGPAAASSPEASSAPDAAGVDATTRDALAEEEAAPVSLAEVDERTQRARRIVAIVIGGLAVLLLGGLAISALGGHKKTGPSPSASAVAAPPGSTAPAATASEEPAAPSATAAESSEPGEADAGAEETADAAPEAAAEDSGPEEVASATAPPPAPHPHPVIRHHYTPHPKPKPKHKYTPSGI